MPNAATKRKRAEAKAAREAEEAELRERLAAVAAAADEAAAAQRCAAAAALSAVVVSAHGAGLVNFGHGQPEHAGGADGSFATQAAGTFLERTHAERHKSAAQARRLNAAGHAHGCC